MNILESVLNERNVFHNKARGVLNTAKTNALRRKLMKSLDDQLTSLIERFNQQLTETILEDLIIYANNDTQNAIIQIGNLIIDNASIADYVKNKLVPRNNEYWCWLVKILLQTCSDLGTEGLNWIVQSFLKKNKSNFAQTTLMQILVEISENQQACSILCQIQLFILQLYRSLSSTDQNICSMGFKILSNLVAVNDQISNQIIQILQTKIDEVIQIGLLKSENQIRLNSCMIMSNLALNGYVPTKHLNTIILKSTKQRQNIITQISYFFTNVADTASFSVLQHLIENGLLNTIIFYLNSQKKNLIQNGISIIKNIMKRLRNSNNEIGFNNFYGRLESSSIICLIESYIQQRNIIQYLLS